MEKTTAEKIQILKNKLVTLDVSVSIRQHISQLIDERCEQQARDWPGHWDGFYDNGLLAQGYGWDEHMVKFMNACGYTTKSYDEVNALSEDAREELLCNSTGAKIWSKFFTE